MNSEKPIRIRMMLPTIRTTLRGTSKMFSSNVPKTRKKNSSKVAEVQARHATRRCACSSLPSSSLRNTGRDSSGLIIANNVVKVLTNRVTTWFIGAQSGRGRAGPL
jgi:hypothetical protein